MLDSALCKAPSPPFRAPLMQAILPEQMADHIQRRLPHQGRRFLLRDALEAMEDFYINVRVDGDDDDDDTLIAVAGRYGDGPDRHLQFGLFRSVGFFTQLEVSLRYPLDSGGGALPDILETCDAPQDSARFFGFLRESPWFGRFALQAPVDCAVHWRGEEEMAEMFCAIAPVLIDELGPDL